MAKYTYKEIKDIINCTPAELKGQEIHKLKNCYVGSFRKASANWAYMVYCVEFGGRILEIVATFGTIQ